jgi:hypothetical protein
MNITTRRARRLTGASAMVLTLPLVGCKHTADGDPNLIINDVIAPPFRPRSQLLSSLRSACARR